MRNPRPAKISTSAHLGERQETAGDRRPRPVSRARICAEVHRPGGPVEEAESVKQHRRGEDAQVKVLGRRLLGGGIPAAEIEEDVGGDRDHLQAEEQQTPGPWPPPPASLRRRPRASEPRYSGVSGSRRACATPGAPAARPPAARASGRDRPGVHLQRAPDGDAAAGKTARQPPATATPPKAIHRHTRGDGTKSSAQVDRHRQRHQHDLGSQQVERLS